MVNQLIKLQTMTDPTLPNAGALSVVEMTRDLDFKVRRIYYIYGANASTMRGHHAHKKLHQLLICIKGVIKVDVDDGENVVSTILDNPSVGLPVGPRLWRTMEWLEDDSILLVMASLPYDENDYIRDYSKFLEWIKTNDENSSI